MKATTTSRDFSLWLGNTKRLNLLNCILLIFVCIFSFKSGVSQNSFPNGTFERGYGTAGDDEAYDVCKTSDKGWAVVGYSNGFGNDKDFYIVKFDSNGVVKWSNHLNVLGIDVATTVTEAANGDILVAGVTKVSNLSTSYTDVLLARYSANGTFLWNNQYNSVNNDEVSEVIALPNGTILIAGATNSSFNTGDAAVWITDASGTLLSTKTYSKTGKEIFNDAELAHDGTILLCSPSTNGTIDIIWLVKMDQLGDTIWTRQYNYNYNWVWVNGISEMLNGDIVIAGAERQSFGSSNSYDHITDSLGNLKRHVAGLTLLSNINDVSGSRTIGSGTDNLFLQTGTYVSYQNRFGIASADTTGFGVYWRFLDLATYQNFNYPIDNFNPATNAITTDIYDTYFIGSCIVGSTKLSGYGGLDFAIARSDFQDTKSSSNKPCIVTAANAICNGDSAKLSLTCNPRASYRWMRISTPANYNLGSDTVFYAKQGGVYCLAALDADSNMWLSNVIEVILRDTAAPLITASGTTNFCAASGQSVTLTAAASMQASYQWYKDSILISGATLSTYTATASGIFYCIMTNACGSYGSLSTTVNANLAPSHFSIGGGPIPNIVIIHPWCASGLYDQPIQAPTHPSYSYAWYLTTSIMGTQLISTGSTSLPQDTGKLICITSNGCGIDTSDIIQVIDFGPPKPWPYQTGIYPISPTINKVCPGFSEQLTVPNLMVGQYSGPYQWFKNGNPIPGAYDSVYTVTSVGDYTVTFMDQFCSMMPIMSGVISYQAQTPILPASMTITASSTLVCQSPVYLYAPAIPGFTNWNYAWEKVGTTNSWGGDTLLLQSWMGSGDYYCTLSNGFCSNKLNSNIIHIDFLNSDLTSNAPPSLCSSPGGVSFSVQNQLSGSTYQWYSNISGNLTLLTGATSPSYFTNTAGFYYCDITNGSCTVQSTGKYLSTAQPSLQFSVVNQPTCGQCNGFLQLNSTPNMNLPQWSSGGSGYTKNNLCPGTYIAYSTDVGGCQVADTITLAYQNNIVVSQLNAIPPSPGMCDGQVTIVASGGTPPYIYSYAPTVPSTGFCEGVIYVVTVTDNAGCTKSDTVYFALPGLVWPGDANADLVANNFDLFPIGQAYGDTGGIRASATITWNGQVAPDWSDSLNGLNNKHIDCNGDGVVNVNDTLAISQNYGLTHQRLTPPLPASLTDPDLYFTVLVDTSQAGDQLLLPINLGTLLVPADSIYGIAMTINYSKNIVDSASVFAKFDSCWIGTLNSNLISIQKDNYSNGRIDLAVVRTDKQNQSGHGTIGILSIDMKDDLSGRTDIFKMLELSFSNVSLIRFDGTTIPVNAINDSIVVHDEITALQQLQMLQNSVSLIPNPAKEKVTISWNSTIEEVTEISICSAIGETVLKKQVSAKSKFELSTSELNAGVYIVKMQTNKGSISKKLCIIN